MDIYIIVHFFINNMRNKSIIFFFLAHSNKISQLSLTIYFNISDLYHSYFMNPKIDFMR